MKRVKITHNKLGVICDRCFDDNVQMKLFVKLIHVSIVKKESLDYYDGNCDFLYVPYNILRKCVIVTDETNSSLTEHFYKSQKKSKSLLTN